MNDDSFSLQNNQTSAYRVCQPGSERLHPSSLEPALPRFQTLTSSRSLRMAMATLNRTASPSSSRTNGKHQVILRAATKVFARNGFFNSKVADVAREAGVADGTVYLYFKNKDDLLLSIINEALEIAHERLSQELPLFSDPFEKLRRMAELHLEFMGSDRDLAVVFEVEIRQSTKFMEQFSTTKLSAYFKLIRQIIEEGQQSGHFRSDFNAQIATKIFFGALDEMVTNWILSHKAYNLADYAKPVVELLFRGFARPSETSATQTA